MCILYDVICPRYRRRSTGFNFEGMTMTKQASNVVDMGAIVRGFVAYAESTETIERAQSVRFGSRKIVADFVRANHDKQWKTIQKPIKAAIDGITVGIVKDKVGLLGVVKTCIEYSIMPTTLNADRLRKAKTWVSVDGKNIPNTYGKVHTVAGAGKKASTPTPTALNPVLSAADAEKIVDKQIAAIDKEETKKAAAALDKMESVLDTATMTPSKATTPQKDTSKVEIARANVSNSDAPIPAREHCGILLDQLFKNESFRQEYAPILALMLDVEKSTLTRCLVQARDEMNRGNK